MGLFDSGKKAAKFAFITMPMAALGVNQLRMGNQHIKSLWRSNFSPTSTGPTRRGRCSAARRGGG